MKMEMSHLLMLVCNHFSLIFYILNLYKITFELIIQIIKLDIGNIYGSYIKP